jgi:hypothetical protein
VKTPETPSLRLDARFMSNITKASFDIAHMKILPFPSAATGEQVYTGRLRNAKQNDE